MNTWEKVKFGEVIHFPPKIKMKKGVEYPFIPMENLDSNNKFAKPLSSKVLKGGGAKFEEGDTLFARITPCLQNGKISQAKDLNGTPGFGSTEFFVFRGIDGITDTDFIYYLSKTKFIRESAENSMVGASGRQRADAGFLKNLEIKLPPLLYQKKIASILSAYDDLIENNLKRIKLLEEKAQLTYQEWFVRMKYPGNDKVSLDKVPLGSIVEFHIGGGWGKDEESDDHPEKAFVIRGTDINRLKHGNTSTLPLRWHKTSNLKSRKLKDGDIVFEVSGGSSNEGVAKSYLVSESMLNTLNQNVMCASFCKLLRLKNTKLSALLYLQLQKLRNQKATEVFEKKSASSIINFNWEAFLKYQTFQIPSNNELERINNMIYPLLNSINVLGDQINKLNDARNLLLPRLLSGMIDIDEIKYNYPKEILE